MCINSIKGSLSIMRSKFFAGLVFAALLCAGNAQAALSTFQTFNGKYAVSTGGWGSTTQAGTIRANVPAGATVAAAYLYTSTYSNSISAAGGTLQGTSVSYTALGLNGNMEAGRADVTSIVAPIINAGPGGAYDFSITETAAEQDGSALVVVYQLPSLPISTVAILDGFSASAGDTTKLNFASPLNPAAAGFFAEMRLGIGFSCCNQRSSVTANGTLITENAGNNDDSVDPVLSNGNLITVGDDNDPFSTLLPAYADDHERYNLVPYIAAGDLSIQIDTRNPSGNDNIFLAVFYTAGLAGANEEPPVVATPVAVPALSPLSLALVSTTLGLFGLFGLSRKRRS